MTEVRTYIPQTGVNGVKGCEERITKLTDGRIRVDTFKKTIRQETKIYTVEEARAHIIEIENILDPFVEPEKLVWSDEFEGTSLDKTKWQARPTNLPPNGELQAFTDRPVNLGVGNGNLAIRAWKEAYGGKQYTSARVDTKKLFEFTFGRVEARMKIPSGQGLWTAFWGMGNDDWEVGWPACGEFDVVEAINSDHNAVASLHAPGYNKSIWQAFPDIYDGFHTFGMEWKPGEFIWTYDGKEYARQQRGAPFDHPFYLILTLSVGGDWPGPPNANTVFPASLLVDYVRVYETLV